MRLKSLVEKYGLENIPPEELDNLFRTENFYPSRGNTETQVPVILEDSDGRRIDLYRWDLVPGWWNKSLNEKKFSSFNARLESITEKATYKSAWRKGQRCIIPATSFFEWPDKKLIAKGAQRREHQVNVSDQEIFSLAGLWDRVMLPGSEPLFSCTIITLDANAALKSIPHTRMPAILLETDIDAWLDVKTTPDDAFKLLRQYPAEMTHID